MKIKETEIKEYNVDKPLTDTSFVEFIAAYIMQQPDTKSNIEIKKYIKKRLNINKVLWFESRENELYYAVEKETIREATPSEEMAQNILKANKLCDMFPDCLMCPMYIPEVGCDIDVYVIKAKEILQNKEIIED